MLLQSGQVLERIAAVELAGVDEAQIQVAHGRTVFGLEEQGVLAMQDRLLDCLAGIGVLFRVFVITFPGSLLA